MFRDDNNRCSSGCCTGNCRLQDERPMALEDSGESTKRESSGGTKLPDNTIASKKRFAGGSTNGTEARFIEIQEEFPTVKIMVNGKFITI